MVVCYIVNQLRKSGPVDVLHNLVKNIHRPSFMPMIVRLMDDDKDRSVTSVFEAMGIEVLKLSYSFYDLELRTGSVARTLDKLLAGRGVDIIHTHGYHPVLVASKMRSVPLKMETMHCICRDDYVNSKGWLLGRYMDWRYRASLARFTAGVAISSAGEQFYHKAVQQLNVCRIYNGVDTSKFAATPSDSKKGWREKLGLPPDKRIFIVVGGVVKIKDPGTVVSAFMGLPGEVQQHSLLLFVGGGSLLEYYKKEALPCPAIRFEGYVFNVAEYLKAADYAICASKSEGFGMACVEALMSGLPVIASNIGPFREFTDKYRELANLRFDVGNIEALRERMMFAYGHDVEMDEIAKDIQGRFSMERMVNDYSTLYRRLKNEMDNKRK